MITTIKILSAAVLLSGMAFISGQVAIGKGSVTNSSVSLEFGDDNKGIVLPWVTDAASVTGQLNGTVVYDLTDHKVKVKYASGWTDLSIDTTGSTIDPITSVDGILLQNPLIEDTSAEVTIGTPTSNTGILILEDTNKAMILPKVASPHLNIINPSPGMMVYDTTAKQLAVFNGAVWTFWE